MPRKCVVLHFSVTVEHSASVAISHHSYASATTRLSATLVVISAGIWTKHVFLLYDPILYSLLLWVWHLYADSGILPVEPTLNFIPHYCLVNHILALAQKVCSSRRVFQAKVHARLRTLIAGQQLPLFVCLNSCFIDATATACNYSGNNARTNRLRNVLHVLLNSCIVQRTFLTEHAVKTNYKRYVRGNGLGLLVKWRVYVYENPSA